jgi:hypothetical protein
MKAKFLVDKSKVAKTKYKGANQEEVVVDRGYICDTTFSSRRVIMLKRQEHSFKSAVNIS